MKHTRLGCLIVLICGIAAGQPARGDGGWLSQSIPIQEGWNLVWVGIDPIPGDPDTVLQSIDYASIWSFVPGRTIDDPGQWVSYVPNQPAFLNTLGRIQGNRGYLIKANAAGTLALKGRPINRALRLSGQSLNLFGADSDPGNPTRFYKYFAHPNEQGKVNAVFRMNPDGTYQQISLGSIVEQNQAYWIGATQDLPTHGPIAPDVPLEGLQFAKSTYSQTLTIEVPRNNIAQTITVEALASATPANGEPVDAAGNADWLEWYDETDALQPWKPLTTPVVLNVAPNQTKVELEVRCVRKGKAAATEDDVNTSGLYQGLIQLTDVSGNRRVIATGMEVQAVHGVWIGQARLTQVSLYPESGQEPVMADAPPMTMSLILALPGAEGGDNQLLDNAYVEVDRDGRTLKYRYNAIMFHEPVTLTGFILNGTSETLTGTTSMAADHPLNPYRHRYHPEHTTGYPITRAITLQFTPDDQDPDYVASGLAETAGDNELSGLYTEVISGVSLRPITVTGYFKLHRLSETTDLQSP
jgi:hypothetical protein